MQDEQVRVREVPLAHHRLHGGGGFGARAVATIAWTRVLLAHAS
jgi:hypothetical protein